MHLQNEDDTHRFILSNNRIERDSAADLSLSSLIDGLSIGRHPSTINQND